MDLLKSVLLDLRSFFLIVNRKERHNVHGAGMPIGRKFLIELLCHLFYQGLIFIRLELFGQGPYTTLKMVNRIVNIIGIFWLSPAKCSRFHYEIRDNRNHLNMASVQCSVRSGVLNGNVIGRKFKRKITASRGKCFDTINMLADISAIATIFTRQEIDINIISDTIDNYGFYKGKELFGVFLISVLQQYPLDCKIAFGFLDFLLIQKHIDVYRSNVLAVRENERRYLASDDSNIFLEFIQDVDDFTENRVGSLLLAF